MPTNHVEILVEELSMEVFLRGFLGRHLPPHITFNVAAFQGKTDLLRNVGARLRGYRGWLPDDWKILILIDRDGSDCIELKGQLEEECQHSGFLTRSAAPADWSVATCIAIEELEAWYFGDWAAVLAAFPRAPKTTPANAPYRLPDAIAGGTWEAFERVMKQGGYFQSGLQKVFAARAISEHIQPDRSTSTSFRHFAQVVQELLA